MAYHELARESGGSADDRLSEARRILKILESFSSDELTVSEAKFIEDISDAESVTTKQLFWLRDIKDKYL